MSIAEMYCFFLFAKTNEYFLYISEKKALKIKHLNGT